MKAFGNGAYLTTIQDAVIKNVRIGAKNKSYTHLFCLKKGVKGKQKERGQVKGDTDAKQTRKWPDWRYGGSTNKRSNLGTVARSAGRCCVVFVFFFASFKCTHGRYSFPLPGIFFYVAGRTAVKGVYGLMSLIPLVLAIRGVSLRLTHRAAGYLKELKILK